MQLKSEQVSIEDINALIRDKYNGDKDAVETAQFKEDLERLAAGEPLAYIIGWIPFLDLKIFVDSNTGNSFHTSSVRPLIPRPETEWWTEKLISHLKYKFEDKPFEFLDLCAGSGAIGLAVLSAFPNAEVSFAEIEPTFEALIQKNISENKLDASRVQIYIGDLFAPITEKSFDIIASNPPYIPATRNSELDESVTSFEPHNALFSGEDGLTIIKKILTESPDHLNQDAELWIECDIANIGAAENLAHAAGFSETSIHEDQYGRPRLLILLYS